MPTQRPRHTITETEEVTEALEDAAQRWPEHSERPARLLLELLREGRHALAADQETALAARRRAIEMTSGELSGSYEPGYLEKLRGDWPE